MPLADQSLRVILEAVAAKTPTPGGGAVAAIAAGLAAAIGNMVVRFSAGKNDLDDDDRRFADAARRLDDHAAATLELAQADAAAFNALSELWKLAADDPRRIHEWPVAVHRAIDIPSTLLDHAVAILDELDALRGLTNRRLDSDLVIAAILGEAAARCAACNITVNLPQLDDEDQRRAHAAATAERLEHAAAVARRLEAAATPTPPSGNVSG